MVQEKLYSRCKIICKSFKSQSFLHKLYLLVTLICTQFLLSSCFHSIGNKENPFGKYSGPVKVELLSEGREVLILENVSYTDPNKQVWEAPKGAKVDGASIPFFLWSLTQTTPFVGKHRDASVFHDVACQQKTRTWESVHLSYYYALRASGVKQLKAKTMYAAVHHFGPRWPIKKRVISNSNLTLPNHKNHMNNEPTTQPPFTNTGIIMITVPSAKQTLTKGSFDILLKKIEETEQSGDFLSLEEIRDFKVE